MYSYVFFVFFFPLCGGGHLTLPTQGRERSGAGVTSQFGNKRGPEFSSTTILGFMLPSHTFIASFNIHTFPRRVEAMYSRGLKSCPDLKNNYVNIM